MVLALDMSKWGGDFTYEEAECAKESGVDTVILATGPGGYSSAFQIQVDDAIEVGLNIEAYTFLEWQSNPEWWIQQAVSRMGAWKPYIRRFWIDVEDIKHTPPPSLTGRIDYVQRAFDEAERLLSDIQIGLYTGGWYWRRSDQMANTTAFRDRLLWNSFYDGDPDIDGLPYGGWTTASVAVEQYTGTVYVCGQSVDTNYIYIPAKQEEKNEDEDMADTRLRQVLAWRHAVKQYAHGLLVEANDVDAAVVEALYRELVAEGKIQPVD